ncbi:hypothetical protein ACUXZZ_20490 [Streptomyces graminifolii]|uniref:hypothetical protein n=1 Tax=Streptomyces graminifolii TaxID=1266771 RepID=UPI0040594AFA
MTSYDPLRGPEAEPPEPGPVDSEVRLTRALLDEMAPVNIHDHMEMIRAAVRLEHRLRNLLAALDAERGEGQ